jgi:hypothetical protein
MEVIVDCESGVRELISILQREIRSFTTLLELLIIEEKGLIDSDNNLLIDVLGRQEDVLSSISCLEKSRQDIVNRIAAEIGSSDEKLTVSQLADKLDNPLRWELRETAHVLSQINEHLQRKKTTNTMLIRQGALLVENNLRYLLRASGREKLNPGTYSSRAGKNSFSGSIGIDGRM